MKQIILSIAFLFSIGICFGQKVKGDTLEVVSKQIRYIKIDGIVYEIKRSTTLQEVKPVVSDSTFYFRTPTIQYLPNFWHTDGKNN